ncbi:uncharacterized protein LOC119093232 [Pollicipes pollicipes]|uniref:uncharacterized protein LOC119093232 n=1 Tax=Pollicipes pollicipes TaxID=41117 RepID=UPI001885219C|nr:uncharacterized protein LOC119093232 [Pollicipes pollicipes]
MAEEPGNGRLKLGWTANNSEVDWSAALVDNERLQRRRRCCMCCILWIFNFLVIVVTAVLLWEILSAKQHFLVFGIGREQTDSTSSTTENPVTSTQPVTSTREGHKATSWKSKL